MAETIFRILKVTVIIAICAVFMVAINTIINLILSLVFGGIITEILGLISMYLPFNALVVFSGLATTTVAIFSFLIAKKIFDLTSWSISSI